MQDSTPHRIGTLGLGITDVSAAATGGCGCGGACGGHGAAHGHGSAHGAAEPTTPTDAGQRFAVAGMTCSHCVSSVTEELTALDGVQGVAVDLRPGALSTVVVTASRPLDGDEVRAAVEEAGYTLAS